MINSQIWYRYSILFFLLLTLPFVGHSSEKLETIFEQPAEEKVPPTSTFFITPRAVKHNYRTYQSISRSIRKMEYFTIAEQYHYTLQNLGNNWTAAQPIFYSLPHHIGATYGLTAYDFYFPNPQDMPYYCMPKSKAYTHFNIVLANLGSYTLHICYSHRLNPYWHIGTNFRAATTEIEWPREKRFNIVHASPLFPYLDFFTHFKTPGECYHLFASWYGMEYIARETGGIKTKKDFAFNVDPAKRYQSSLALLQSEGDIQSRIPIPNMENIDKPKDKLENKDVRHHFHLYHHYELDKTMQLYHELHYKQQKHSTTLSIKNNEEVRNFIGMPPLDFLDDTIGNVVMRSIGNEIGLKGDIDQIDPFNLYYGLYYRIEDIHLYRHFPVLGKVKPEPSEISDTYPNTKKEQKEKEYYVGFNTRLNFSKNEPTIHELHFDGAYLFPNPTSHDSYYKINTAYHYGLFILSYHNVKYKVPYITQYGYSSLRPWKEQFEPPFAQKIAIAMEYKLPWIRFNPIANFQHINHHIYYQQAYSENIGNEKKNIHRCVSLPVQTKDPVYLFAWGGNIDFCFYKYWHLDHTLTVFHDLSREGERIFHGYMPPYMYTMRYYFAQQAYSNKREMEIGFNVHFKDLYYADGYDIIAQQFYRQNQFPVQGNPIIDLFVNYRLGNLKLFLKYGNAYGFLREKGYFVTPFYPGQRPSADIGVHWSFFD